MKTIIANKSWFHESDLRLDASFHLGETNRIKHHFKHSPYAFTVLSKQADDVFSGNIFRRIYVKDESRGLPYLTGSDIIKSDIDSGKYISRKQAINLQRLILKEGWILVTCSGTLGNVVYTNKLFEGRIGTHDLIRIIPNNKDIKSGFLYAYLVSRFGHALLTQSSYGGVVKHIEPHHIKNLPVPIFPPEIQQQIHNLIIQSAELRVEANRLLEEVESIMFTFLGITSVRYGKYRVSSRNINEIFKSFQKRIDAPAFINEGVNLIDDLKSKGYAFKSLKDCEAKVTRPGIFKRVYVKNNGYPYIKGSELSLNNPFANCVYLSKSRTPFLNELKLRNNQILITCAGSVGDVRLITKEFEDLHAIGSQDIIRIDCKEDGLLAANYIYAYLRLPFVYEYIQSLKYGSVIERIEPFHVDLIPILIPTDELFIRVSEKIARYKENLYSAFCKESQAIQLVEKEIDQWQN